MYSFKGSSPSVIAHATHNTSSQTVQASEEQCHCQLIARARENLSSSYRELMKPFAFHLKKGDIEMVAEINNKLKAISLVERLVKKAQQIDDESQRNAAALYVISKFYHTHNEPTLAQLYLEAIPKNSNIYNRYIIVDWSFFFAYGKHQEVYSAILNKCHDLTQEEINKLRLIISHFYYGKDDLIQAELYLSLLQPGHPFLNSIFIEFRKLLCDLGRHLEVYKIVYNLLHNPENNTSFDHEDLIEFLDSISQKYIQHISPIDQNSENLIPQKTSQPTSQINTVTKYLSEQKYIEALEELNALLVLSTKGTTEYTIYSNEIINLIKSVKTQVHRHFASTIPNQERIIGPPEEFLFERSTTPESYDDVNDPTSEMSASETPEHRFLPDHEKKAN